MFTVFEDGNALTGSIPSGVSQLTALKVLYLGKLLCIGWFQRQHYTPLIQVLTPLFMAFKASNNALTGSIPSSISQWTTLINLYLGELLCIVWLPMKPLIQVLTHL